MNFPSKQLLMLFALLTSINTLASPCDPLLVFNNKTTLSGFFFGNYNEAWDSGGSVNMDITANQTRSKTLPSMACQGALTDPQLWEKYYRNFTGMTFYSNDAIQKTIPCTILDGALKSTNKMITTLSQDAQKNYQCQMVREPDPGPPPEKDRKIFVVGTNATLLISPDGIKWNPIETPISGIKLDEILDNIIWGQDKYLLFNAFSYYTSTDGIQWQKRSGGANDSIWTDGKFITAGNNNGKHLCPNILCASSNGLDWEPIYRNPYWNKDPLPNQALNIAKSENKYVVIARNDIYRTYYFLTSENGKNWINASHTNIGYPTEIISGNNQFIALYESGNILTSSDGMNWVSQKSGTQSSLNSVAWGKDKFVAVGSKGVILTSLDGVTWISQASGTTYSLNKVMWINNQFIAVGQNGTILTSPNGITWTAQHSGTSASLRGIGAGKPLV